MKYVFEECLVFQAQQILSKHMNAAYSRPHNNPYVQTYNLGWRNHLNFYGVKTTMTIDRGKIVDKKYHVEITN